MEQENNPMADYLEKQRNEELGTGLAILSFCIPIAGAIIYFTSKDEKPKKAKKACHLALWGMGVGLILNIISFAISYASMM